MILEDTTRVCDTLEFYRCELLLSAHLMNCCLRMACTRDQWGATNEVQGPGIANVPLATGP